jgi:tRNA(Ile)-lysidine synthase
MPGPEPAVAHTRLVVREALESLDPQPDRLVLAAVSGGVDSLALAAALAFVTPRMGVRAGAVIVDHGLQDGSAEVAERAAAQCRSLGLAPVEVVPVRVRECGDGPESAARRVRHAALAEARQRHDASHLMLAHTRDDQAEQVLLGLLRGSGSRSLAGMAPASGALLRPFLDVTRAETESACAAARLTPWHDPHNDDERYARVRARALLAELNERLGGGVSDNLARTARLLRDDNAALDAWAQQVATVDVAELAALPRAVRTRVLRLLLLDAGADSAALGSRHLDEVERLVTDWHGQGPIDVPGAVQVARDRGALAIGPRRRVE